MYFVRSMENQFETCTFFQGMFFVDKDHNRETISVSSPTNPPLGVPLGML